MTMNILLTLIFFLMLIISGYAQTTPFKVRITEEQHKLANDKMDKVLGLRNLSSGQGDQNSVSQTALTASIVASRDPFEPQIPRPQPEPGALPSGAPQPTQVPQPQTKPKPVQPQLMISGIIWNSDRPQAIINNQVVDIGNKVNESTIVAINKSGVDVVFDGEKFTIPYN